MEILQNHWIKYTDAGSVSDMLHALESFNNRTNGRVKERSCVQFKHAACLRLCKDFKRIPVGLGDMAIKMITIKIFILIVIDTVIITINIKSLFLSSLRADFCS